MPTKPIKIKENSIDSEVSDTDREGRWKVFVASYKASNPVKYASKEARGEFNKIPASFK